MALYMCDHANETRVPGRCDRSLLCAMPGIARYSSSGPRHTATVECVRWHQADTVEVRPQRCRRVERIISEAYGYGHGARLPFRGRYLGQTAVPLSICDHYVWPRLRLSGTLGRVCSILVALCEMRQSRRDVRLGAEGYNTFTGSIGNK